MENYLAFPTTSPLSVGQAGAGDDAGWPAAMRETDGPSQFPHPAVYRSGRDRRTGARVNFDYTKQAEAYDAPAICISERSAIPDAIEFIKENIGRDRPALVPLVIRHPGAPA